MSLNRFTPSYWSGLIKHLKSALSLSQTEFADRLGIDQSTVSRWERGLSEPQYEIRKVLEDMARERGLAMLDDAATVVRHSPFPMILVDRKTIVMAASVSSGFAQGLSAVEQTPPEERPILEQFNKALEQSGFWERKCAKWEYEANVDGELRRAIVVAINMRGEVYALVQRAW